MAGASRVPLIVVIFGSLLLAAAGAALFRAYVVAAWLASAASAVAALVFVGDLVTLDDDAPGGWSNHGASKQIWAASLRELTIKLAVLVTVTSFAVWLWWRSYL
jgi:hypothetical protein